MLYTRRTRLANTGSWGHQDMLCPQRQGMTEAGLCPQSVEDEMSLSDRELRDVGRGSGQALRGGDLGDQGGFMEEVAFKPGP